jgi:hypothetical protein
LAIHNAAGWRAFDASSPLSIGPQVVFAPQVQPAGFAAADAGVAETGAMGVGTAGVMATGAAGPSIRFQAVQQPGERIVGRRSIMRRFTRDASVALHTFGVAIRH